LVGGVRLNRTPLCKWGSGIPLLTIPFLFDSPVVRIMRLVSNPLTVLRIQHKLLLLFSFYIRKYILQSSLLLRKNLPILRKNLRAIFDWFTFHINRWSCTLHIVLSVKICIPGNPIAAPHTQVLLLCV